MCKSNWINSPSNSKRSLKTPTPVLHMMHYWKLHSKALNMVEPIHSYPRKNKNKCPLKIGRNSEWKDRLPIIRCYVNFREGKMCFSVESQKSFGEFVLRDVQIPFAPTSSYLYAGGKYLTIYKHSPVIWDHEQWSKVYTVTFHVLGLLTVVGKK